MTSSSLPSIESLTEELLFAYALQIEYAFTTADEITAEAQELRKDLSWIGLEKFQLLRRFAKNLGTVEEPLNATLVQYDFGEDRNSIHKCKPDDDIESLVRQSNIEGLGLNTEDLRFLCDVCRRVRSIIPVLWRKDEALRNDLREPRKHISTLNELFWLTRWRMIVPSSVVHEAPTVSGNTKSVDWSFDCKLDDGKTHRLNTEVKFITTSIADAAHGMDFFLDSALLGLKNKFASIYTSDLNIVCYTVFVSDAQLLDKLGKKVLDALPGVDCVLTWIPTLDPPHCIHMGWRKDDQSKKALIEQLLIVPGVSDIRWMPLVFPDLSALPQQQQALDRLRAARKLAF